MSLDRSGSPVVKAAEDKKTVQSEMKAEVISTCGEKSVTQICTFAEW